MGKLAILKIGDGDFEQGFPVTLRIGEDGVFPDIEKEGRLPPAPMIPEQYECWQSSYRDPGIGSGRGLEAPKAQTTNSSIQDSADQLQESINEWLNSGEREFRPIRDSLLENLSQNKDEIRFIIQAEDVRLWRLPWHLWDVIERFDNVEVALSLPKIDLTKSPKTPQVQVRILVILGESPDINVKKDLELLKQRLPDADIFPLPNPQREQLSDELWKQNWDILFFAGHSSSDGEKGEGRFDISQSESLTIRELKQALRNAIAQGLKLAIFNSCDGLGLARNLADLGMPAIIAMRERVPDQVAQRFLDYFFEAFATRGKSLYASVREARKRLHTLENQYPCASWLPVICQNLATVPLTWQKMFSNNPDTQPHQQKPPITSILRQPTAIALSLSLLLFLVELVRPQSADFTCGPSLKTYRVTRPLRNTTEGVRCVKFGKGNIQNGLPVFSWFGEGKWGDKYRHLGHAFADDTDMFTGYAADFSGNGEETIGKFDGTLKIEFSNDRVSTTPKKITVKEDGWDEEWKLEEDNNVEDYRSPFINTGISTCGGLNSGFIEEPITDSVVRCTLKFQPPDSLPTSDYFTWYKEGKRHGFHYSRIGTLDNSEYEISDICKRAKFIGDCQLKSLVK